MLGEWLSELMSDVRYRVRALVRRAAIEQELDEELRFHLEREAAKHRQAGMSPEDAMRQARLAFGGLDRIKEASRDARGLVLLETLAQDIRYAGRALRRSPGFTAAVVLTLALGLGANAAMFGVIDRLMFRPPPYLRDPGSVNRVYVFQTAEGKEVPSRNLEYTRYLDFNRWTKTLSHTAAFGNRMLAVGSGEDTREMQVATVSASFFDFFDARPVLGRFFTVREDRVPYGSPVAVLSYALWQTRYGGRRDVIGTPLQVGPIPCTVIGVAPRDFVGVSDGDLPPAVFIPITAYAGSVTFLKQVADYYLTYHWGWLEMLVRRKPGVSVQAATSDLTNAYRQSYAAERASSGGRMAPAEIAHPRAAAEPVQGGRGPNAGPDVRVVPWISGVALIVLLIACANVANLLLARSLRRRREIAVRLALGVSRRRLLAQLLTESILLALLGGVAGLLVAQVGGAVLRSLFLPHDTSLPVVSDSRTMLFVALVALVTGALTGLVPALDAGRGDLATGLKAGVREGPSHRSRTRTVLLLLQAALCVVLLVGAGLFVRSLENVRALRIGYDVDPVLITRLSLRGTKLSGDERAALARRLQEEATTTPGVVSASRILTEPFWNTWSTDLFVPGIDSVRRLGHFTLQANTEEYFQTVGTRLLRGRGVTAADRKGAPLVMVVSQAMAQRLWPGKDAIGQCIRVDADTVPCTTVVGIAENIKQNSLTDDAGLHYYLPIEQFHPEMADLALRTTGEASRYAETVRRHLQHLMPGASYVAVTPMSEIIDPNVRAWQLGATMFLAFGVLALIVAAVGLYSVIAYNVAQRTHELGVRIALGAQLGDVLRLIVGEGVRFAVVGVLIGGVVALWAGRWLRPLLFAESPTDPLVFGSVTGVLLGVALLASVVPGMRASRVDPNVALRSE